ncbi:hypothetical protein [Anianabacter salinae]|uniref:hypothetical protein n=1 Tax=Anianabacter salinae TaxID=2851023 RepID=UPI00225E136A|nr:hypothetical protein [Anianabacter salinae]MBV0912178.1 hypothetical protein [Anianabacter salinae]
MIRTAAILFACGTATLALAAGEEFTIDMPPEGSVSRAAGLEAWDRIYEVTSHPRCSNCHVGEDNIPLWSGPSYGGTMPHGMNVNGGESRIGAEYVPCQACHAYREEGANDAPHMAPQVAETWALAPVETQWLGKSSTEICAQLRDPERNLGHDLMGLAEHIQHSALVQWGWTPGGGREPAPYSVQEHIDDLLIWGVAGFPCATDEE